MSATPGGEAGTARTAAPPLDQRVLPCGMRLLITPMPHARSVTVSFYVGAGSRYESDEVAGISHLVEHLCFKGSQRRPSAPLISEAIEGVGGVLNAGTDRELTVYYAKVPSDHLDTALDVITDMVLRPVFAADDLEKERNVILEELATVEDAPGQLAEVELDALLWPGQALGRDVAGTPESVRAISHERTYRYRYDHYTPQNALISVAGAVDPDRLEHDLAAMTEEWPFGQPGTWEPAQPAPADAKRCTVRNKPTEQAHLMIGLPGISAQDPDRYALGLLIGVLGDGMSSRLFVLLREDLGLAYDVHAYATNLLDTGAVSIYLGVDPSNAERALRLTLDELGRLREGVTPAELTKIREYMKGHMLLGMEDTRAVSSWYGGQALLLQQSRTVEQVVAELDAVTHEDLVRVADRIIRDRGLRLAMVGPFDSVEPYADALHL